MPGKPKTITKSPLVRSPLPSTLRPHNNPTNVPTPQPSRRFNKGDIVWVKAIKSDLLAWFQGTVSNHECCDDRWIYEVEEARSRDGKRVNLMMEGGATWFLEYEMREDPVCARRRANVVVAGNGSE